MSTHSPVVLASDSYPDTRRIRVLHTNDDGAHVAHSRLEAITNVLNQNRKVLCFYLSLMLAVVALIEPFGGSQSAFDWWLIPSVGISIICVMNAAMARWWYSPMSGHVVVWSLAAFIFVQIYHHTGITWAFLLPPLVMFLHPMRRALVYMLLIVLSVVAGLTLRHVSLVLRDHEPYEFWGSLCSVTAVTALLVRDLGDTLSALTTTAFRDSLTGLYQRDLFGELARRELESAKREGKPVAILALDVDNLKAVNDRIGHAAGDNILREVSGVLEQEFRATELTARFGGDEFVVLLPGIDSHTAQEAARRVQRKILLQPEFQRLQAAVSVAISIGVAAYPQHGATIADIHAAADAALLAAKAHGKNGVVLARQATEAPEA